MKKMFLKNFFSGFKYKLDRAVLRNYLQHTINFAVENKLPFCDEFFVFMDMGPTILEQYMIK